HRGRGCAPIPIGAQRARTAHRRAMVPLERWALECLESRRLLASGHAHVLAQGHGWARLGARSAAVSNVAYEGVAGRRETLDLYLPKGTPPPGGWPVLVAIHGGGWRRFNKDEYGPKVAAMVVPEGIAVVAMNYTLSARGSPSWPANFEDVRNAVRWARS